MPEKIVQREDGAAVKVLVAFVVQYAQFLQAVDDVAVRRKDVEQRSVGEADAIRREQSVIGDAPANEVIPGPAVFAE